MTGMGGEWKSIGWNEESAFVLRVAEEEKGTCMLEVGMIS